MKQHNLGLGIKKLIVALTLLVVISTAFYKFVEGWSLIDALYFTVSTISTVGYGDLVPSTAVSKIFTLIMLLTGVTLLFTLFGIISVNYAKKHSKK